MKRLLVCLGVFYGLGIVLFGLIHLDFWFIAGFSGVVFLLTGLWMKQKRLFLMSVLFLALLAGYLNSENSRQISACHIRNFISDQDSPIYSIDGFVTGEPEQRTGYFWFILRTREIQIDKLKYKCCGDVLVKSSVGGDLHYGDNLRLLGNLKIPYSLSKAGSNYREFLSRQGIYLMMTVKDPRQITSTGGCGGCKLIKICFRLRFYLEQIIRQHLPELPASILSAMLLGQRHNIPRLVNLSMVQSGTVHILVVSGFNVGIVAFIMNLLFKILRFKRKARIVLVAVCLIIYCLLTGATNPVVRATIMGLVFLWAYLLKRQPDIYNSLATAAIIILAVNPRQLFDIGFQLSFASVLAIVYFYPRFKVLIRLETCRVKTLRFIAEGCLVSFSAWLGTLIIIVLNFHIIVPVTVLANILIVPLATLITLCGLALVISGLIFPELAYFISFPCLVLINLLLNINAALIKLPFAFFYL